MFDYTVDLLIFGISNKENMNIRELSKKTLSVILVKRDKEPFSSLDDTSNLIHLQKIDVLTFFPAVG